MFYLFVTSWLLWFRRFLALVTFGFLVLWFLGFFDCLLGFVVSWLLWLLWFPQY